MRPQLGVTGKTHARFLALRERFDKQFALGEGLARRDAPGTLREAALLRVWEGLRAVCVTGDEWEQDDLHGISHDPSISLEDLAALTKMTRRLFAARGLDVVLMDDRMARDPSYASWIASNAVDDLA